MTHIHIYIFLFNHPATTEIYPLSLHDALPISFWFTGAVGAAWLLLWAVLARRPDLARQTPDRKSTRLNSSHSSISYAVFCLKKKKRHRLRRVRCFSPDHD